MPGIVLQTQLPPSTPLAVVANVSRVVTKVADRVTGDRSEFPLLVAMACHEALKNFKINSQIMYGPAAWVEVLQDQTPIWAGCWGKSFGFWIATQYGEVVDLNTSVAHRKRAHNSRDLANPEIKALYSPPILWAIDVPKFYRYKPEGIAEIELHEQRDQKMAEQVLLEIQEKCRPELVKWDGQENFPNEPILCPDRRVLDDSQSTFRHFERALAVGGLSIPPF